MLPAKGASWMLYLPVCGKLSSAAAEGFLALLEANRHCFLKNLLTDSTSCQGAGRTAASWILSAFFVGISVFWMVFSHSSHPLPFSFPGNVGFAGCFVHSVFLLGLFLSESDSYRLLYPRFRSSVSAANRISRHLYGGSGIRSKQCGIHDAGVYASVLPGRMGGVFFPPKCRCFPEPKPGQTLGYPVLFPSLSCLFQLNRLYELSCGSSNPGPHTPAVAAVPGAYEGFEADISHSDSCYTGPVPWGNEKRSPSSLTVRRFLFQMGSGPWGGQPLSFGTFRDTTSLSTGIFFPAPYSKNPITFIIFGEVFIPWKAIAEKIVCSVPTLFSAAVPGVNGDLVSRCRGSVPWPGAVGKRDMEPAAPVPWPIIAGFWRSGTFSHPVQLPVHILPVRSAPLPFHRYRLPQWKKQLYCPAGWVGSFFWSWHRSSLR